MIGRYWMAAPVALALSACGGGGTSNSGGTITVVPPTPTPTPTPSPPPSPSYQSARDFTQDRTAQDFGARIETFSPYGVPEKPKRILSLATTTALGAISFSYSASTRSYRVNYFSEARNFVRVQPYEVPGYSGDADYSPSDPSPMQRYFRLVYNDTLNPSNNLQYVGISSWSDVNTSDTDAGDSGEREIWRHQLYGAHTVVSDLPTTGTSTYRLYFPLAKSAFEVQINWASGAVSGAARAICAQDEACPNGDVGEVKLNGSFDGSNRVLGTISGAAGYTGTFVGGFYGPRALEIGIVGDYRHPTRVSDIFYATSRRLE
jgi:hypothetical protein